MKKIKYSSYIIFGAAAIIILSQILSGFLTTSSFEKTYKETMVSRYRIIAKEIRKNIETAIDYGKPLDRFGDYNRIIDISSKDEANGIQALFVTSPDGTVYHSKNEKYISKKIPFKRVPVFKQLHEEYSFEHKSIIYTALPLFYNKTEWVGVLYVGIDSKVIKEMVKPINAKVINFYGIVLPLTILFTLLLLFVILKYLKTSKKREVLISLTIFLLLAISQIVSGLINNNYYEKEYFKLFSQNMRTLSTVAKTGFDFVLSLDTPIERLKKAEIILQDRVKDNIECLKMAITDTDGRVLYEATKDYSLSVLEKGEIEKLVGEKKSFASDDMRIVTPLTAGSLLKGYLFVYINRQVIVEKQRNLLLDILTVILVSIISGFELLGFLHILIDRSMTDKTIKKPAKSENNLQIIRFTAFVFFFAELIPLSFMPIYINDIFILQPLKMLNLSPGTIMGLPISAYMFGVMLFVPLVGFIADRISVKKVLLFCSTLLIFGAIGASFSNSIFLLSLARFISGAGYGGLIISSTNLVLTTIPDRLRTTGFGYWSGGFASAAICAVPIGGILVTRVGFKNGMLISGAFSVILLIFILLFIKKDVIDVEELSEEKKKISPSDFLCIFKDRNLLANTLFSSIPFSLAFIGLFQYIFPLFMKNTGVSQGDIGRVLTIFGIVSLLTPVFSRYADKLKNDKFFITMGNLINGLFLLFFLINRDIYTFIIVIIGLGFGSMLTDAATESFITSTKTAKKIGEAKTLGIITTYEKLIAIFVPIAAGALISYSGYTNTAIILAIFILISTFCFFIFSTNPRAKERKIKTIEDGDII